MAIYFKIKPSPDKNRRREFGGYDIRHYPQKYIIIPKRLIIRNLLFNI
jgi:hypothetical protein